MYGGQQGAINTTFALLQIIQFPKERAFTCLLIVFVDRQTRQILNSPHNVDTIIRTELPEHDDPQRQDIVFKPAFHSQDG